MRKETRRPGTATRASGSASPRRLRGARVPLLAPSAVAPQCASQAPLKFPKPRGRAPRNEEGDPATWDGDKGEWVGVAAETARRPRPTSRAARGRPTLSSRRRRGRRRRHPGGRPPGAPRKRNSRPSARTRRRSRRRGASGSCRAPWRPTSSRRPRRRHSTRQRVWPRGGTASPAAEQRRSGWPSLGAISMRRRWPRASRSIAARASPPRKETASRTRRPDL